MGFYSTTFEQEKPHQKTSDCAQKTASGKFFTSNRNRTYQIERNPLETQQEKLTTTRETASGVFFYKYRHYSAELGRWLGRDPIEEKGGINLYAFVGNDGINRWDELGLQAAALVWKPKTVTRTFSLECQVVKCPCSYEGTISWEEADTGGGKKLYRNIDTDVTKKINGPDPACVADVGWGAGSIKTKDNTGVVITVDGTTYSGVITAALAAANAAAGPEGRPTLADIQNAATWPPHIKDVEYVPGTLEVKSLTIVGDYVGFNVDISHVVTCGTKTGNWPIKHKEGDAP